MAIYSSVPPPNQQQPASGTLVPTFTFTSTSSAGIETWKVEAQQSIIAGEIGNPLSVPFEGHRESKEGDAPTLTLRGKTLRDSQKRCEALLKGKEGSRRRQRWENDRLLHVPNVQPPLPSDWEVHPTHPVTAVPYYLAPLWEAGVRRRAEEAQQSRTRNISNMHDGNSDKGRVPVELKEKLKRSKGAKTMLMDLEEQVRHFVQEWEIMNRELDTATATTTATARLSTGDENINFEVETDSSDEEIVFVGRQALSDPTRKRAIRKQELEKERLVFAALVEDRGAGFARWLVHSLAQYYGLTSRSVTVGDPAMREVRVGIREMRTGKGKIMERGVDAMSTAVMLPRPLWGLI